MHVAILSWSVKFCGRACNDTSGCFSVGNEKHERKFAFRKNFKIFFIFCKFKGQNFLWKYFVMLFQEYNSYINSFSVNIFCEEKKLKFALFICKGSWYISSALLTVFITLYPLTYFSFVCIFWFILLWHQCIICHGILPQFYCEVLPAGLPEHSSRVCVSEAFPTIWEDKTYISQRQ